MLGLRSTPKVFVISFTAITLSLLTASTAVAQTSTVPVIEKAAVESTAVVPESVTTIPVAPTATTKEEPAAPPAADV